MISYSAAAPNWRKSAVDRTFVTHALFVFFFVWFGELSLTIFRRAAAKSTVSFVSNDGSASIGPCLTF